MDHDFYATAGPMTLLPKGLGDYPTDSHEICQLVQGILIHRDWALAYDLDPATIRHDEQHLRSTKEVLARLFEMDHQPITIERLPGHRVLSICRHFALLHTALLRSHGQPARVRCGFSNYFDPNKWVDHWITERWHEGRWIREDPQVDALQLEVIKPDFDVFDQPPDVFLTGAEAWAAARAGTVDPQLFGIAHMSGIGFIAGNVVQDFACLNKVELLPWDIWGPVGGPEESVEDSLATKLDSLAKLMISDDTAAIRQRYETDDELRVPTEILSFIDGEPVAVELQL